VDTVTYLGQRFGSVPMCDIAWPISCSIRTCFTDHGGKGASGHLFTISQGSNCAAQVATSILTRNKLCENYI